MTTEEALAAAQVNDAGADEVITIDNNLRTIIIPASITLLGVVSDENVQTLHFQMPKIYKGLDLSEFAIRINYMNANNAGDVYAVDDSEISGENIVFTWTVGRVACMYKGNTKFIVCLKKKDASGNVLKEFNTSLASLPVLEGLETTEAVVAENPDIIEQILTRLDNVTEIPQEKVTEAVSTYMEANPINVPKNLSDLKEDAEHRTVTDTEKQSWDNKSDFDGNYESLTGKPTIPTVPEWAKAEEKPAYTASEVGALPSTTVIPSKLSELTADDEHETVTKEEKQAWNAKSDFSGEYRDLRGKPELAEWALQSKKPTYTAEEVGALPVGTKIPSKTSDLQNDSGFLTEHQDLSDYALKSEVPKSASDVGADTAGTAENKVSEHNISDTAHNDIRLLVQGLTARLNALADSDDTTLDQMSEVVAYIKNNKNLIDGITTSKVNVSDIINNLTTNMSNKVLSASMGVELKKLIDAIKVPVNLSELAGDTTHRTVTDAEKTAWNNKSTFSGSYNDLTNKPSLFSGNYNDLSGKPTLITEERVNELINAKLPKSAEEVQY